MIEPGEAGKSVITGLRSGGSLCPLSRPTAPPGGRLRSAPARRIALRTPLHRPSRPESARELAARPRESLVEIAAEIGECHDRLIAPHWERIRPVLEADISYRAGLLAGGGARSLFSDLHPDLRWSGGTLTLTDTDQGPSPFKIRLGPDGVVLMPSIFNWPRVSPSRATSTSSSRRRCTMHPTTRARASSTARWR